MLLLVLSFIGWGFYLFSKKPAEPAITPSPSPSINSQMSVVAQDYYDKYNSCLKNPPAAAEGNVSVYCQENTGLTSANFINNLAKGGVAKAGADPVLCAQNTPDSIAVSSVNPLKNQVTVAEKFGTITQDITVSMVENNGSWQVDNIICPAP